MTRPWAISYGCVQLSDTASSPVSLSTYSHQRWYESSIYSIASPTLCSFCHFRQFGWCVLVMHYDFTLPLFDD